MKVEHITNEAREVEEAKRQFAEQVEAHLGRRAFRHWVDSMGEMTDEERKAELQSMAKAVGWDWNFV
jgi:hypothetical protein